MIEENVPSNAPAKSDVELTPADSRYERPSRRLGASPNRYLFCETSVAPPASPPPPARSAGPPAAVVVSKEKIELRDTILFGTNNSQIQAQSQPLIDAIAKVLNEHPEIQLVSIEGHTDDRGRAKHNQKLSEARAKSVVDALVARGIDAGRLKSAGYGATQPIVANDSADNRAKNRRVELRIERRAD